MLQRGKVCPKLHKETLMAKAKKSSSNTALAEDGGPFGRSLFDDPSVRALSRVGVVDVGSNSVRMVVFDGAARSPAYFYNEKLEI